MIMLLLLQLPNEGFILINQYETIPILHVRTLALFIFFTLVDNCAFSHCILNDNNTAVSRFSAA